MLGLVCLPAIIYFPSLVFGTPMASRYALPMWLGIAPALAFLASNAPSSRAAGWLLAGVISVFGFQQLDYWRYGMTSIDEGVHPDLAILRNLRARSQAPSGQPIVVSNGLRYLPMAYYTGTAPDPPLVYLADLSNSARRAGTDSVERALVALAPYVAERLYDPVAFVKANPSFLLFSENEVWDWVPVWLSERKGVSVRLLATDRSNGSHHTLSLVTVSDGQ